MHDGMFRPINCQLFIKRTFWQSPCRSTIDTKLFELFVCVIKCLNLKLPARLLPGLVSVNIQFDFDGSANLTLVYIISWNQYVLIFPLIFKSQYNENSVDFLDR